MLEHDGRACVVSRIGDRPLPAGGGWVRGFVLWLDDVASRGAGGLTGRSETLTVRAGATLRRTEATP